MEIKIVPITQWIGKKNQNPRPSQFRATYSDTLKILKFELEKAGIYGDSAQLQMFIRPDDMRLDGNMRANSKPYEQGVKLVFQRYGEKFFDNQKQKWKWRLKTVSYPCDAFDDWHDNLRAIALSMEALRRVERYGVFKYGDIMDRLALPSADGKVSDRDIALTFLSIHSGFQQNVLIDPNIMKIAYTKAATKLHPDKGGSNEDFLKLQEVKRILGI